MEKTKEMREQICHTLEKMAGEVVNAWGCRTFWGEIELPACMREEFEKEEA